MVGEADNKDKNESRTIAIALISIVLIAIVAAALLLPAFTEILSTSFAPGLGLRDSAVIAFFVTIVILVVFAIAAGDGLIGELQFILSGFFAFFIIIWLMLAWLF